LSKFGEIIYISGTTTGINAKFGIHI